MTIFRCIYKNKLRLLLQALPEERREKVVAQAVTDISEWDAFRFSLPWVLFPFFHSRRKLEEIDRKFLELVTRNYENL